MESYLNLIEITLTIILVCRNLLIIYRMSIICQYINKISFKYIFFSHIF